MQKRIAVQCRHCAAERQGLVMSHPSVTQECPIVLLLQLSQAADRLPSLHHLLIPFSTRVDPLFFPWKRPISVFHRHRRSSHLQGGVAGVAPHFRVGACNEE